MNDAAVYYRINCNNLNWECDNLHSNFLKLISKLIKNSWNTRNSAKSFQLDMKISTSNLHIAIQRSLNSNRVHYYYWFIRFLPAEFIHLIILALNYRFCRFVWSFEHSFSLPEGLKHRKYFTKKNTSLIFN